MPARQHPTRVVLLPSSSHIPLRLPPPSLSPPPPSSLLSSGGAAPQGALWRLRRHRASAPVARSSRPRLLALLTPLAPLAPAPHAPRARASRYSRPRLTLPAPTPRTCARLRLVTRSSPTLLQRSCLPSSRLCHMRALSSCSSDSSALASSYQCPHFTIVFLL
ncbi:hypothetical protein DENSPDRAFT_886983 [Dentipellis sp. KUC8613]|nr:hypothetical protein DENSPDRAFT_886983 [Dentipellis sp. KUC8613]